ncbi:hypothetical protein C8Q72DRAFT_145848 [Fomitopsis betulina]|nr:hypothetical protein C8Q72DRAFT_145848 [Fomitopsis betulina]
MPKSRLSTSWIAGVRKQAYPPRRETLSSRWQSVWLTTPISCVTLTAYSSTLDLINHPENADKSAVAIAAHIEWTDMSAARERMMAMVSGREPPPLPKKIPKLFQISKTAPIENKSVLEGLDNNREEQRRSLKERGYMNGTSAQPEYLVRAFLVPENKSLSTFYFTRYINQAMLDEAKTWTKWTNDGATKTDEPVDVEYLIKMFDLRALEDPQFNKILSIMVEPNER